MTAEVKLFNNRVAVLGTMHQKERAIAPLLEQQLGIKVIVPKNFDTDAFGTFTLDVQRMGTQIEAARFKAEKALEVTGESLAIASEGTFGPHPLLPFIPANKEIVLLLDKANDIEIIGEELSTETNYAYKVVDSIKEAYDFAVKIGFPSHGLVVKVEPQSSDSIEIIKGITTESQLFEAVTLTLNKSPDGKVRLETDMRALYNPTRLKNIEKATRDLIRKINLLCPNCSWPGFELIERKKGLPCAACAIPTNLTRAEIYKCKKCGFIEETLFPGGLSKADPSQCLYCNP